MTAGTERFLGAVGAVLTVFAADVFQAEYAPSESNARTRNMTFISAEVTLVVIDVALVELVTLIQLTPLSADRST